jgi:hypothetical protein
MPVSDWESGVNPAPPAVPEAAVSDAGANAAAPSGEAASQPPAGSPGTQRFLSCRWRKGADGPAVDYCTHRDVQPMAGTAGFTPESWCLDCSFFKVRRTPRKRPPATPVDRYYY